MMNESRTARIIAVMRAGPLSRPFEGGEKRHLDSYLTLLLTLTPEHILVVVRGQASLNAEKVPTCV